VQVPVAGSVPTIQDEIVWTQWRQTDSKHLSIKCGVFADMYVLTSSATINQQIYLINYSFL